MNSGSGAEARTLAVHTGGIGDFLLACPALSLLSREGDLALLGRPGRLALARLGKLTDEIHDIDAVGFESAFSEPNQRLRAFLTPFQRAVIWMKDDDGLLRGAFNECGVEEVSVFPGVPPQGWQGHASEYYTHCLGYNPALPFRLGVEPASPATEVIIHPGSGGKRKNWPMDCFEAVAQALEAGGCSVSWCVGPAEEGLAYPPGINAVRCSALTELAATLAGCACYLGNDSGVTHLAAAAGCAVVAVFGPTDPSVWAPQGENVRVVQDAPWPRVEDVAEAVRESTRARSV